MRPVLLRRTNLQSFARVGLALTGDMVIISASFVILRAGCGARSAG